MIAAMSPRRRAQRAAAELRIFRERDRARTLKMPMGSRQKRILEYAHTCIKAGGRFPTARQIYDHFEKRVLVYDIGASIAGLEVRGLIERIPGGDIRLTNDGWHRGRG